MELLHTVIDYIVELVSAWGYLGIFIMMFLESSFFPFPSEVVMIPAGYLAFKGEMSIFLVITFGVLGSVAGAWLNYLLALHLGRRVLLGAPIVGRFVTEERLARVERFFVEHGPISTFNGRLIPVVRQYISFPAGLARMNGSLFTLYTTAGASIWVIVLTLLGYFIGDNQARIEAYLHQIVLGTLGAIVLGTGLYVYYKRSKVSDVSPEGLIHK